MTEAVPGLARVEDEDLTVDDFGQAAIEGVGVEQADRFEQLGVGDRPGRRHDPQQLPGLGRQAVDAVQDDALQLGRQRRLMAGGGELLGEEGVSLGA